MEQAAAQAGFDRLDPAVLGDPYPLYKALYGRPPMVLELDFPTVLLARHADVVAAVPVVRRHLKPTALIEWPSLSRLLGSDWPRTLEELEALKRR